MSPTPVTIFRTHRLPLCLSLLLLIALLCPRAVSAQTTFAVATIKPSAVSVPFEHDGKTDIYPNSLRMQDATVATCLKFAYGM